MAFVNTESSYSTEIMSVLDEQFPSGSTGEKYLYCKKIANLGANLLKGDGSEIGKYTEKVLRQIGGSKYSVVEECQIFTRMLKHVSAIASEENNLKLTCSNAVDILEREISAQLSAGEYPEKFIKTVQEGIVYLHRNIHGQEGKAETQDEKIDPR